MFSRPQGNLALLVVQSVDVGFLLSRIVVGVLLMRPIPMLCILKALVAWAVLILIGINLAGFIMRGLVWEPPTIDAPPTDRVRELLENEIRRMRFVNAFLNVLTWTAATGYLFALYYYWGIGLVAAGAILILTRVPDLLWEFQTGKKATSKNLPPGPVPVIAFILMFATLPLVWYSLCR